MYYSKCDFLHLHLGPILQGNHIFVTLYGKVPKKKWFILLSSTKVRIPDYTVKNTSWCLFSIFSYRKLIVFMVLYFLMKKK